MLVAVIMAFVVLSFTGVAVLDVSYNSRAASMETIDNIKVQYLVESSVNEALWRINTGVDSLVNSDADGIVTVWNADTQTLTISVDTLSTSTQISLDLSEDTHFDRGIAAEGNVTLNGNDPGLSDTRKLRSNFQFMPEVDLQYFLDNAVSVHTEAFKYYSNNTFPDGIHVFTGNYLTVDDIRLVSGTMVFTGHHITFRNNNQITAPPADSTGAYAALIFTNPNQDFNLYSPNSNETILGAIYCAKTVTLTNGYVSGPILGHDVIVAADFNMLDSEHPEYYQWTHGFGDENNYDWPKQVDHWLVEKWLKTNA